MCVCGGYLCPFKDLALVPLLYHQNQLVSSLVDTRAKSLKGQRYPPQVARQCHKQWLPISPLMHFDPSRSKVMAANESPYMISYLSVIQMKSLSVMVFEIVTKIAF